MGELAGAWWPNTPWPCDCAWGKLYIKVARAPLRHELTFMREALKNTVNAQIGRNVVEEVVLD